MPSPRIDRGTRRLYAPGRSVRALRRRRTCVEPGFRRYACTVLEDPRREQRAEAAALAEDRDLDPVGAGHPRRQPGLRVHREPVTSSRVLSAGWGRAWNLLWVASAGPVGEVKVGSPQAPCLNRETWNGVRVSTCVRLFPSTYQPTAVPGGSCGRLERGHRVVDLSVGRVAEHGPGRLRLRVHQVEGPAESLRRQSRHRRETSLPGTARVPSKAVSETVLPTGTAPGCQVTVARPSSVWRLPAMPRRTVCVPVETGGSGAETTMSVAVAVADAGAALAGCGHDERERGADVVGGERPIWPGCMRDRDARGTARVAAPPAIRELRRRAGPGPDRARQDLSGLRRCRRSPAA